MALSDPDGPRPHLLLIGGGHAHTLVLQSIARGGWPPVRVTLLAPSPRQFYSGMVPGFLEGRFAEPEITIDLRRLAGAAGADFVGGEAEAVDAASSIVHTTAGAIPFTHLSLDIGSAPAGERLPDVAELAMTLRPMSRVLELAERVDALAREGGGRVAIVGGGAGAVEIALALLRRTSDRPIGIDIVESASRLLPSFPLRASRIVTSILQARGGRVITGREAAEVTASGVRLADGETVEAQLVVWLGGAAPPPLLARSDLPLDPSGFLAVGADLRARTATSAIWGAGDCVQVEGLRLPRSGVVAVRQAPVLAANLRAALTGTEPRAFRARRSYLSILNTADGRALLRYGGIVVHSRAARLLKDRLDRGYVRRYTV